MGEIARQETCVFALATLGNVAMPLEGLEHVLSILHDRIKRQLPRNRAALPEPNDIERRPKTANREQDAAKMRASIPVLKRRSGAYRKMTRANGY